MGAKAAGSVKRKRLKDAGMAVKRRRVESSSSSAACASETAALPAPESYRLRSLPPYLLIRVNMFNAQLRARGVDVIDLGMGNPVDPVPEEALREVQSAVVGPTNQRYSHPRGIPELRAAFGRFVFRHFHVELDPEKEIIATIGSKEGFSHFCLAAMGPGDLCVTPMPAYMMHRWPPFIAGAQVLGVPMTEEEPGAGLLDDIRKVFEKTEPRPKFLILNFPNNPTAKMVKPGFYEEVVALAKRLGFWVVNDFAYGLTTYDGRSAPSFLAVKGAKDVGAELFTMSKQHNMAGWRIGFFAGNARLVECLAVVKGYFDYGHNQALQLGAVKALDSGDRFIREQCVVYQKRRDALLAGLADAGWGRLQRQNGTMFTWQRMPESVRQMGSLNFCFKLAEEAGVSFTPGIAFGPEGEGFVRIALVADEERIREACRRVKKFLGKV